MSESETPRRPLKTRENLLAKRAAQVLLERNVSPDQISLASIGFALIGALLLVLSGYLDGGSRWVLLLLAAITIQGRLLCNLLDGMVAVEGGRATPAGQLFNEVPDRICDVLFLVAVGYALPAFDSSIWLAWLAAVLAVATAYVRVLGQSLGLPADFRGPMAKPHRMALLTAACVLSFVEWYWGVTGFVLYLALWLLVIGTIWTLYRRLARQYGLLSGTEDAGD
jgi:phosphatidylglycerophosphate synthase